MPTKPPEKNKKKSTKSSFYLLRNHHLRASQDTGGIHRPIILRERNKRLPCGTTSIYSNSLPTRNVLIMLTHPDIATSSYTVHAKKPNALHLARRENRPFGARKIYTEYATYPIAGGEPSLGHRGTHATFAENRSQRQHKRSDSNTNSIRQGSGRSISRSRKGRECTGIPAGRSWPAKRATKARRRAAPLALQSPQLAGGSPRDPKGGHSHFSGRKTRKQRRRLQLVGRRSKRKPNLRCTTWGRG